MGISALKLAALLALCAGTVALYDAKGPVILLNDKNMDQGA